MVKDTEKFKIGNIDNYVDDLFITKQQGVSGM